MHASWTSPFPCGQRGCGGLSKRAGIRALVWPASCASTRIGTTRKAIFALPRRGAPKLATKLGLALPSVRERAPWRAPTRHFPDLTLRCGLAEVGEVALESESDDKKQWRDGDASSAGVSAGGAAQLSCRPFMVGWAASVSAPPVGKRATSLLAGRTGRQPPWSTITGFSCCRGCVCTDLRRAFSTLRRRD